MPQHIVIAGGAGFVGSNLCEDLLKKSYTITCVDSLITGRRENVQHLFQNPRFAFLQHDITKPLNIEREIHFIMNLASPASPIDYQKYPIETLRVGAFGTWNLLELARAKQAVFLLTSTSEVYGDPQVHPQKESYWGNVNPVGPRSCYDEAKRYAESLTIFYGQKYNTETRIARVFNTYGPRMRVDDGRALPTFLAQALLEKDLTVFGDGSQTRSFCYVEDMVAGLEKLAFSNEKSPVNLGNPNEMTLLDFAKIVVRLTGSASQITFCSLPKDDPKVRRPDITKAKQILGWEPKVDLESGIRKTIPYFSQILNKIKY